MLRPSSSPTTLTPSNFPLSSKPTATPTVPLECSNAYSSMTLLWPPNHKFQAITTQGVVTYSNGNEFATAKGESGASKVPDAFGIVTNIANLKAQCSGVGNCHVYHIDFTTSNGIVGTCQGSVWAGVPHDQNKPPLSQDTYLNDHHFSPLQSLEVCHPTNSSCGHCHLLSTGAGFDSIGGSNPWSSTGAMVPASTYHHQMFQ